MRNQSAEIETRIVERETKCDFLSYQQQELIEQHVNFARSVAKKFFRKRRLPGIDFEDLVSAAMVGLCDAASRFDVEVNDSFKGFSQIRIHGAMLDYLRSSDGCPAYIVAGMGVFRPLRLNNYEAYEVDEEQEFRKCQIFTRACEEWGIKIHIAGDVENSELSYVDQKSPEQMVEDAQALTYVKQLMTDLPSEEQQILALCYFEDCSLREIGKLIRNVSKSWVSRVHSRAIDRLKDVVDEDECSCGLKLVTHGIH